MKEFYKPENPIAAPTFHWTQFNHRSSTRKWWHSMRSHMSQFVPKINKTWARMCVSSSHTKLAYKFITRTANNIACIGCSIRTNSNNNNNKKVHCLFDIVCCDGDILHSDYRLMWFTQITLDCKKKSNLSPHRHTFTTQINKKPCRKYAK